MSGQISVVDGCRPAGYCCDMMAPSPRLQEQDQGRTRGMDSFGARLPQPDAVSGENHISSAKEVRM